jgi:subtilisin family serine protease/subtilisin-like proprotein convertase family protein
MPSPAFAPVKGPRAPLTNPAATLAPPADTIFLLDAGSGQPLAYAVALDELYLAAASASGPRLTRIPAQPDLRALLAHAASAHAGSSPRLVLYPVGAPRLAATRRIVNPRIEVALASASAPSPVPRPDLGIASWERPASAPDRALARIAGDPAQPLRAAAAAAALPGVRSARPLLARQHAKKAVPNDPLFKDQWHLRNTGQQGGSPGVDIRAVPAWDTATGLGVTIGVVDDGLDLHHPDLAPALDASLGYDWNDDDPVPAARDHDVDPDGPGGDPSELTHDDHGTAVAGLAAARGFDALGVAGSAPRATLAGLRLIAAPSDDSEDADAMAWRTDAIQIKNNSWGPPDAAPFRGRPLDLAPAGALWAAAIVEAVTHGRDGLGTLFFFATGNGQARGDQGVLDGYATDRHVIAVSAADHRGAPASFSEGGPHVVVSAPGDARIGLVTTDRLGDSGYNSSTGSHLSSSDYSTDINHTRAFTGTSAATPVAAGVAALLLEARPDLGWRDVKEIFLRSGRKLQASSSDWVTRPAGDPSRPIKHHPRLGGGLANALDALDLARDWTPLGPEIRVEAPLFLPLPRPISTAENAGQGAIRSVFVLPADAPLLRVEHVVLTLDIAHAYRGDLEISLTSPSGVVSRFITSSTDFSDSTAGYPNHPFSSVRHWGELSIIPGKPTARWVLEVRDILTDDVGELRDARLTLFGTPLLAPAVTPDPPEVLTLATGSTLVLRPAFSGGNLTYQWKRAGRPIPGATSPEYRLANFSANSAGTYECVATNELGSAIATTTVAVDDTPRQTITLIAAQALEFETGNGNGTASGMTWSASGLPPGLSIEARSGLILGASTRPGTYRAIITTTSADGVLTRRPYQIVIAPLPAAIVGDYAGVLSLGTGEGGMQDYIQLRFAHNGTYSGIWTSAGRPLSFKGTIETVSPDLALLNIRRPAQRIGPDAQIDARHLALRLPLDGSPARGKPENITSHLSTSLPAADALIALRRAPFSARQPATAYVGAHTFLLSSIYVSGGRPATLPGRLVVTPAGRVAWLLRPLDHDRLITGSAPLTEGGWVPLAAYLRTPLSADNRAVGWLVLPADPAGGITGEMFVSDGFPATIQGGRYTAPTSQSRLLGTTDSLPTLTVTLSTPALNEGQVTALTVPVKVGATNRLTVGTPNPSAFTATFDPATGFVSGKFTADWRDPLTPSVPPLLTLPYHAVWLPRENRLAGAFFPARIFDLAAAGSIEFTPAAAP